MAENETNRDENLIDYTTGVFKKNYSYEGCKYYYIVCPELYEDDTDGLEPTGAMLITLCHPKGTVTFKMLLDDATGNFIPENKNLLVDEILLKIISDAIHSHNA
jgi:hypothetical protein